MKKPSVSKLCALSAVDVKADFDERIENCFTMIQSRVNHLSVKDTHDTLVAMASASKEKYQEVSLGLLYGILTSPAQASQFFRDMSFVTTDGWHFTLTNVNFIVVEWYFRLLDPVRKQLLWFLSEAIKNGVPNMDDVCVRALRNLKGGELEPTNLWLADSMVGILRENRQWLLGLPVQSILPPTAAYTFLRLICDHNQPALEGLRKKEVQLCESLLREKFHECMQVGSDLVRLLIMTSRIPEFHSIWKSLVQQPSSLSTHFSSFGDVLSLKPSKHCQKILSHRIVTTAERELSFLVNQVKFKQHDRHLQWFRHKHLSKSESSSLRCDMIRFLCCFCANTQPDQVPRWLLLNFLFTTNSQAVVESAYHKLALFWDWLTFDPQTTPVSAIEPAYSLMLNMCKIQPAFSASLLDFLCRMSTEFCPSLQSRTLSNVSAAFRALLDQKVAGSLAPLLENPRLDQRLKQKLKELFSDLMKPSGGGRVEAAASSGLPDSPVFSDDDDDVKLEINEGDTEDAVQTRAQAKKEKETTEQELEKSKEPLKQKRKTKKKKPTPPHRKPGFVFELSDEEEEEPGLGLDSVKNISDDRIRELLETMKKQKDAGDAAVDLNNMQQLLLLYMQDGNSLFLTEPTQVEYLAECLCDLFKEDFHRGRLLPAEFDEDERATDESSPIFLIFRNLNLNSDEDGSQSSMMNLVTEMYHSQRKIGYFFLYFLYSNSHDKSVSASSYENFSEAVGDGLLDKQLVKDLDMCQANDHALFGRLLPFVYSVFKEHCMDSPLLVHLIVSTVDPSQLTNLISKMIEQSIQMFKRDSFHDILKASLNWSSIEQYLFWNLVAAEGVPLDWAISIIPKIQEEKHTEAVASILLMLKRMEKEPNANLLKTLLARDPTKKEERLGYLALKVLVDDWADKVVDILKMQVKNCESHAKSRKQSSKGISLEFILGHLDMLRRHCDKLTWSQEDNFFHKKELQELLRRIRMNSSETLKSKFSELFATMEILETVRSSGERPLRRARAPPPAPSTHISHKDNAEDSSEEDTGSRVKPPKKKKKVVESDSD